MKNETRSADHMLSMPHADIASVGMTDEQLKVAAFVFEEERKSWATLKFGGSYLAVRKCGRTQPHAMRDDADDAVTAAAAEALIKYYIKHHAPKQTTEN